MISRTGSLFNVLLFFAFLLLSHGITIPAPSNGHYTVSQTTAKLIDESRTDPYDPNKGKRNVMTSIFYPVRHKHCESTCEIPYAPPITARYLDAFAAQHGIPDGTLPSIRMESCCNTTSQATKEVTKFPIAIFSPGLGATRLLYNAMAQTLAASGYIVATIDHTYDAMIVEYPDGTFTPGLDPSYWNIEPPELEERLTKLLDTRVEDGRFVLSQLGNASVVKSLIPGTTCAFNTKRAAFLGHSFGGATSIAALMKDRRFVGGANMDGTQWGTISNIYKPALLFGRAEPDTHNSTTDATWQEALDHMKAWKRELGLRNSAHNTFGDTPLLVKLSGWEITDAIRTLIGTLDGGRSFQIVTTYLTAFTDFVLKGRRSPLFDGESSLYPEIVVA
ncbi:hypothetical protein CC78DRAFT_12655 [Lojkania enalia]|uniref:1-alkyl-2-acetylglycerophosphocholine esterase n=1 Tax=Lojkania enalia TaxID=147567 RepID=A0A9P4NDI2_9PLEO|nr:hypothetical protein CC78DRAFT_12655 [Didymosphaeria enalia]